MVSHWAMRTAGAFLALQLRGEQLGKARRTDPPERRAFSFPGRSSGLHRTRAILARGLVKQVLLASPRGYCAGVERAVDTVERALQHYGKPVYVRKQIVHNSHVVRELEERGAIFVDSVEDIPEGSTVVFSAHGVAPAVREAADARQLTSIDATCPLVTKVHTQARRYAEAGYTIVLIGHAGHEEVEGTIGRGAARDRLVESVADAEALELPPERGSPTSHRRRSRWTRRARSSTSSAAGSPRSKGPRAKTSATRRPTGSGP